jgi:hypothetical protein
MSVQNVEFINLGWTGAMPGMRNFKFRVRAEVIDDHAGGNLTTQFGTLPGMRVTIVRATVKTVTNGQEQSFPNNVKLMAYDAAGAYHETPDMTVPEPNVPNGTVLRAYIDVEWVYLRTEDDAGTTDYDPPAP